MPRSMQYTLLVLGAAALIPLACVMRARVARTSTPRLHLVADMDRQPSYGAQEANPAFADGRAMRPDVPGTVARGRLEEDDHTYRGLVDGDYAAHFPLQLNLELLERGRERYGIFCAPCHGLAGDGDGMISRRAEQRQQASWVPPSSLHEEPALSRAVGHLFNSVTRGIRTMPAYGSSIPVEDRWAIVAYVRALQRSQRAGLEDVPAQAAAALRGE